MVVVSSGAWMEAFVFLVVCTIGIVAYFKRAFQYWEKRNIPYIKPCIPFGTMQNPLRPKASFGMTLKQQYLESKRKGLKHVGLFLTTKPAYLPIDLNYIKNILSTDFRYFVDRGIYYNEKDDPVSAHLFTLEEARWRVLRAKMTPTFTSGKMKLMFPFLVECGKQMIDAMVKSCEKSIDIKDYLECYTTDVIGTSVFGIESNSFRDPNSDFRMFGKRSVSPNQWENVKSFVTFASESFARKIGIRITPVEVCDYFVNMVKCVVEERRRSNIVRHDFINVLMELKNGMETDDVDDGQHLTVSEIAAQVFLFFLAGFETSSLTGSLCLFELARNQDIQDKVREEIVKVMEAHDGHLTYEVINEMTYLRQVINETLRTHPPAPNLVRKCMEDYNIPGTDVIIEKGTTVLISIDGVHYDPEYHPNPERFDPERFSNDNREKMNRFSFIPFGEGPKMCIGLRFGLMQVAVGLVSLLKTFRFKLHEKSMPPLKIDPHNMVLSFIREVWLNIEPV